MGFKEFDEAQKKYEDEIARLDRIAKGVYYDDNTTFVSSLAYAWLRAGSSDKRILKPAWEAIISKYSLDKEAEG